ncbi:hypothetical protein AB0B15_06110 [Streptomyces sp. NPDC045456]
MRHFPFTLLPHDDGHADGGYGRRGAGRRAPHGPDPLDRLETDRT